MPKSFTAPSAIGLQRGSSGQDVTDLQAFLRRFGYLQETRNSSFAAVRDLTVLEATTATFDDATEEALRSYQQFHGLAITGELDQATVAEMQKPRCGFPDTPSTIGSARFVAWGTRWDHTNITYRIVNFTAELTQAEIRDAVRQAFDLWGAVTPLTFTEVAGNADILISFATGDHGDGDPFDGVGNVLAHAFYPPPNGGDIAGDAHFDDAETWTVNVPVPAGGWDLVTIAAHEFGHSLGLNHTDIADALMFPTFPPGSLHRFLAQDDINGIRSIYGVRFPDWQQLDNNSATVGIEADGNDLYQLHNTGSIWKFTGTPLTGWLELDNNPATVGIEADGNDLYQLHSTGSIWKFTGTPLTGWLELDNNPATVGIEADGNDLYQLHSTGSIWKFTGTPLTGWLELDNNPATIKIVTAGGNLYQLHNTGSIWKFTGTPLTGWLELDNNPATVSIVADGNDLYQLHNTGSIWKFTGTPLTGWLELDNNPATIKIVAAGGNLYQLHNTGSIWKFTGIPLTGWQQLDNNPASINIMAASNNLYQLHNNGFIWKYTG
jgi:predicted Zn-dependent protease